MGTIFKNKGSRLWFIVTSIVVVLAITVNIVGGVVFRDLLDIVLGRGAPITADGVEVRYSLDEGYETKEEALASANALNVTLNEEGIVLLKNENALPIATPVSDDAVTERPTVSVFGKNSVNLVYGGSGSGGVTGQGKTIYESLTEAGFDYNPQLKAFYDDNSKSGSGRDENPSMNSGGVPGFKTGETPRSAYESVRSSYANYNDLAIIVFSRIGGEGADLPRTMWQSDYSTPVEGARSGTDHYLQLDQNETDLIKEVCEQNFKHVVVIINSAAAMELGFLDDPTHYAYNSKIDGALWIANPGKSGIMALGKILSGEVTPSGHLVDTYARDWTQSPTWNNFGNNRVTDGDRYTVDGKGKLYYFVDYEEGIYVGYRYYETRALTDGEEWYKDNVVYPFGYGQSYTNFSWEITNKTAINESKITKDGTITVNVMVKNEGDYAGKDVVQIYASAPYYENGIEKAHKVLVGFAKTKLLQPDETDEVEIIINPYDFASYDYNDANNDTKTGYIVEHGDYTFYVSKNAHESVDSFVATADADILYEKDPTTGYDVNNLYTGNEDEALNSDAQLGSVLSRTDWEGTWPEFRTAEEKDVSNDFIKSLAKYTPNNPASTEETFTNYVAEGESLTLRDMIGVPYDDVKWEQLVNQIALEEMLDMVNKGAFQTLEILSIGKPRTLDSDGPVGWTNFMDSTNFPPDSTCSYAGECILGATWNTELIEKMGISVGNEALLGNGTTPYTGWYAPAVNIHRSAFGGRNFEYFSEDSFLSGKMAAAEIQGVMSKGVYTQLKHFAVNEQETHRSANGVLTWLTEQSMREIYLKPFEIAVKEGGSMGMMSSFNRIGTKWTGGDYRLLTEILRNEWGFKGMVICDYNDATPYMNPKQMVYAGGDLNLASRRDFYWNNFNKDNADDVAALKLATKNILYTVTNSNALNTEILGYYPPMWIIIMFIVDGVLAVGLALWGVVAIRKAQKESENKKVKK